MFLRRLSLSALSITSLSLSRFKSLSFTYHTRASYDVRMSLCVHPFAHCEEFKDSCPAGGMLTISQVATQICLDIDQRGFQAFLTDTQSWSTCEFCAPTPPITSFPVVSIIGNVATDDRLFTQTLMGLFTCSLRMLNCFCLMPCHKAVLPLL